MTDRSWWRRGESNSRTSCMPCGLRASVGVRTRPSSCTFTGGTLAEDPLRPRSWLPTWLPKLQIAFAPERCDWDPPGKFLTVVGGAKFNQIRPSGPDATAALMGTRLSRRHPGVSTGSRTRGRLLTFAMKGSRGGLPCSAGRHRPVWNRPIDSTKRPRYSFGRLSTRLRGLAVGVGTWHQRYEGRIRFKADVVTVGSREDPRIRG
jgi:hypothetical protein